MYDTQSRFGLLPFSSKEQVVRATEQSSRPPPCRRTRRGGSHSGNIAASELDDYDLLDVLSSDYVPASLLLGAVIIGLRRGNMASGVSKVTSAPAKAAGLKDRGVIMPGKRADLLRFKLVGNNPVIQSVYARGRRVG